MLLFNNNKSNKGKKYLRNKQDIDLVYAGKAEEFNTWFSANHTFLLRYLKGKMYYDHDTFNECYLRVYENILFSGSQVSNYKSYFLTSYFTIWQDARVKQNRYCELLPYYDVEEENTAPLLEAEEKQARLSSDILEYAYRNYPLKDFELFKMYMHLKPAVNYDTLAAITGVKSYRIQRIVSRIKKDIRRNHHFVHCRKIAL